MDEVVRHEEAFEVGTREQVAGSVRVRKRVEVEPAAELVERMVERVDELERVPAGEGDSGEIETLPDGSISIPVLEEEIVVSKRVVVRERVIVRKRTETDRRRVEAELRKERVEVEADDGVELEQADETEE